jgi:hypothetical protein
MKDNKSVFVIPIKRDKKFINILPSGIQKYISLSQYCVNLSLKILFIIIFQFLFTRYCYSNLSFRISENNLYSDLNVHISSSTSFPDLSIAIGEHVSYADFTVNITSEIEKANFIITESVNSNISVNVTDNSYLSDIDIKAGESVSFPDITIKITKSEVADYCIYTEKAYISLNEITIVFLPVINMLLDYKYDKIPILIKLYNNKGDLITELLDYAATKNAYCGSIIIAQDYDKTYLGRIDSNFGLESIFNKYGTYGSKYSNKSIWNNFSEFGNQYSQYSPFNEISIMPPMIIKGDKLIGYLTINKFIKNGISPYILKRIYEF